MPASTVELQEHMLEVLRVSNVPDSFGMAAVHTVDDAASGCTSCSAGLQARVGWAEAPPTPVVKPVLRISRKVTPLDSARGDRLRTAGGPEGVFHAFVHTGMRTVRPRGPRLLAATLRKPLASQPLGTRRLEPPARHGPATLAVDATSAFRLEVGGQVRMAVGSPAST